MVCKIVVHLGGIAHWCWVCEAVVHVGSAAHLCLVCKVVVHMGGIAHLCWAAQGAGAGLKCCMLLLGV